MADQSWISLPAKQLPVNAILSFPVLMGNDAQKKKMVCSPGSILSQDSPLVRADDTVFVSQEYAPYLSFYQNPHYWHYAKPQDFDRFVVDYLNSILCRIFYFKRVDHYTFIALYDFVDRFRFAWKQDMTQEFQRLMSAPSQWHIAFRYRIYVVLGVVLLAHRSGYSGFYDLIDFFLGALFADVGHFKSFGTPGAFFAAVPKDWFYDPTHPQTSLEMLSEIEDVPRAVLSMGELHHETLDGTGFPKGLKSSIDIPDQAQMVGIVSEFMFSVYFGLDGQGTLVGAGDERGSVRSAKNFLLKQRQRYSADVYSAFSDLSNTLFP